jgi:hypothetical protein
MLRVMLQLFQNTGALALACAACDNDREKQNGSKTSHQGQLKLVNRADKATHFTPATLTQTRVAVRS